MALYSGMKLPLHRTSPPSSPTLSPTPGMSYFRQTRSSRPAVAVIAFVVVCILYILVGPSPDFSSTLDPLLRARDCSERQEFCRVCLYRFQSDIRLDTRMGLLCRSVARCLRYISLGHDSLVSPQQLRVRLLKLIEHRRMCEEVQKPATQVPIAMIWTICLNTVCGFIFLVPLVFVLPSLSAVVNDPSGQPLPVILRSAIGSEGGKKLKHLHIAAI